jgi:peptidyl-prolyl cis-trans isomerase SurA
MLTGPSSKKPAIKTDKKEDHMRQFGIALLLLLCIGLNTASAAVVSRIAAVVNTDIITTYQLDQKLQEQLAKQDTQPSPAQLGALRQELLSRMIEETLVQQRVKALRLSVSDEEIETALLDVQQKNQLTREELEDAVTLQGMDFQAYRDNLAEQILRYKLIGEEVRSQIDVPEREIVEYYRAHLDDYRLAPEVHLSAITFPVSGKASEQERQKIKSVVREALERLRNNEDFDQVVDSYNLTYGATGSDMGNVAYADLNPEFLAAIESVADGGYSDPVEMKEAILLFRINQRQAGGLRQFDDVKFDIYQTIMDQKTDARIKEWTKSLKTKAYIDIRL